MLSRVVVASVLLVALVLGIIACGDAVTPAPASAYTPTPSLASVRTVMPMPDSTSTRTSASTPTAASVTAAVATPTPVSVPTAVPTQIPTPAPTPVPSYLTEEVAPCTPAPGSATDPCEPDLARVSSHASEYLGFEPWSVRFYLGDERSSRVWVAHLVVRGTYFPGTVRCTAGGDLFRPPPYTDMGSAPTRSVNCYADVRVNADVLGSGPPILTVMVWYDDYWFDLDQDVVEELRSSLERVLAEGGDDPSSYLRVPAGGITGREAILFVGPSVNVSAEAWEVFDTWDVQLREDGTAIVVHPHRDAWRQLYPTTKYLTYRSVLEMELPAFTQAVTTANQARLDEYDGRTAADPGYPMLVTDANQLRQYYTEVGAYAPGAPTPVQPPPPCGLAVPDQANNPGLMRDCITLLELKDTLRGTAALNWGVDTAIATWDGVTTDGTPNRVTKLLLPTKSLSGSIPSGLGRLSELTHLDLSRNSLTGKIPEGLGRLSNLEVLRLSGNSFTGCIPAGLRDVADNDLERLGLQYCGSSEQ